MSPSPIPRELLLSLASAGNDLERAADFVEEYIMHRRAKGDSLYDVSNSLVELEVKVPARSVPAIRQAQYATNVPSFADLTPPGPSHAAAATPHSVLTFLLSTPTPDIQRSREVVLEYVLARETRLRDKKPGRGGKGTLGRDGFEEIAVRLGEIEDGLRGKGPLASVGRRAAPAPGTPDAELAPPRQMGLALVLSLRMLLSYFTLADLARQLLSQPPSDAVRTLVQHIRRRVPGEGRFGVGRDLEYLESLTLHRRPALRPAFRSARARTQLPTQALYPISLPAPSKSGCIKLLTAFIRDVEQGGPAAASAYMANTAHGTQPLTRKKSSPHLGGPAPGSPSSPSSPGSPVRAANTVRPQDPTAMESYTLELVSEWLTRDKREYMVRNKWAKSGREQLSKDLFDVESALCVLNKAPSPHCGALLPIFLLLRRMFSLPATPLPNAIIGSAYEMLPMPPEPDSVTLKEPTVSSTTAALYVNPRLSGRAALDLIEELLESEREKGINADVSEEKTVAWLLGQVDQVQKRFPDGSYETVFEQARAIASHSRVWRLVATPDMSPTRTVFTGHRRSKSSNSGHDHQESPPPPLPGSLPKSYKSKSHSRSASAPMRGQSIELRSSDEFNLSELQAVRNMHATRDSQSLAYPTSDSERSNDLHRRAQAPAVFAATAIASASASASAPDSLGLSYNHFVPQHPPSHTVATSPPLPPIPPQSRERSNTGGHRRGASSSSISRNRSNTTGATGAAATSGTHAPSIPPIPGRNGRAKPPPGLNLVSTAIPSYGISTELSDFMEQPPSATSAATPLSATTSESGWWEVVSAVDTSSPAPRRAHFRGGSQGSEAVDSPLAAETSLAYDSPLAGAGKLPAFTEVPEEESPPTTVTLDEQTPTLPTYPAVNAIPEPHVRGVAVGGAVAPPLSMPLTPAEEHAAAAAAAIAATEAKLAGTAPPTSTTTTATMVPPVPRIDRSRNLPPTPPHQPHPEEFDDGSKAAPGVVVVPVTRPAWVEPPGATPSGSPVTTPTVATRSATSTAGTHSATHTPSTSISASASAGRPPPVPVTMNRPGFPSSTTAPTYTPAYATTSAAAAGAATNTASQPSSPDTPTAAASAKHKLESFGRSMSLGGARIMGRGRDKDTRDKDKEREREQREKQVELARAHTVRTGMIANNPGRWNRDMVVGIMGPPAERR